MEAGIYIPHLCHHPDLPPIGACRLCIVQVNDIEEPITSCTTPAQNDMIIKTKTEKISKLRKLAMELMLAGHPADCGTCNKYLNCEFQTLKQYFGVEHITFNRRSRPFSINNKNPLFTHDYNRCVVCGRCIRACHELRGVGILYYNKRNRETYISTLSDKLLADAGCKFCGACVEVCPTGALQDKEELTKGKSRKNALIPCTFTCPAEIDVPRYIRFIKKLKYSNAAAVIREKVPFPKVLGYICDHPCENVCRRSYVNQAISIRELKRFASENDIEKLWKIKSIKKSQTGKKVAIIGSGPAGLTAAYFLAMQGHTAHVYESFPEAGGMLRYGIPEYRLPKNILEDEIKNIENAGVTIITNTHIESLDELFNQSYDSILIAIGTHKGQKLKIPGVNNEQVFTGVEFLKCVNMGKSIKINDKVIVLGGGNVAFDCARVARRLGANIVNIACLESRESMLASPDEITQGIEEGIIIHTAKTPKRILSENEKITGVEFFDVNSVTFDEDNNPIIEVVQNSENIIEANTVIFAIGQRPQIPEGFDINLTSNNFVEIDKYTFSTNKEGVFAAGDAILGTSSAIKAMASGRKAAIAIDKFLNGKGDIDVRIAPEYEINNCLGYTEKFAFMGRQEIQYIDPEKRVQNFIKIVKDMNEEMALYESNRCLQCDLRLKMTQVKFWSNY